MMNILIGVAVALAFLSPAIAFAQSSKQIDKSGAQARLYRLNPVYRAGIAQNYVLTENTIASRLYKDSTVKDYTRSVKTFVSIRCIESLEGFVTVVVNIDSMIYSFTSDGITITHDTQTDITPKNFADLSLYLAPLNRSYNVSYNAYGEVTKVAGEQLAEIREYLNEYGYDMDSTMRLIWDQGLGDDNLLMIGDIQKRIIPGRRIAMDSSWSHDISVFADGVLYRSPVRSTLKNFDAGNFSLITHDTVYAAEQFRTHFYGIPYIATVLDGKGILHTNFTLSQMGTIQGLTITLDARIRARALSEEFTQTIRTAWEWALEGQYQW